MGHRLFLCGDVMTGRGIDQVLPQPCEPGLHEDYVQSAMEYVEPAEAANGPIPRAVGPALAQAGAPAVLDIAGNSRVLVFSFGSVMSGIPRD